MITLTTPELVNKTLGGNSPVAYEHVVLNQIQVNVLGQTITADVRITSVGSPDAAAVIGRVSLNGSNGVLTLDIPAPIAKQNQIKMSASQQADVITAIQNLQNALEGILVAPKFGIVLGTQTTGA